MAVREAMNKHPGVTVAFTVVCVVACVAWGFVTWHHTQVIEKPDAPMAYYSDDDGKTFFQDSIYRVAPFDHNGKQAVRACVFAGRDGRRFVGYLEKYAPEVREQFKAVEGDVNKQLNLVEKLRGKGVVIKKPGDTEWVPKYGPAAAAVQKVVTPDGSVADAVLPDE